MASPPPPASANGNAPPPPPFLPPDVEARDALTSLQVKIQAFLFLTFAIFLTVLILGKLRSQGNSNMKVAATTLFIITGSVLTYIAGLMNMAGNSNGLFIFWVAFMAFLAAVTNEISCYTLSDNEDRKKRLLIDYSVIWPLILTSLYHSLASSDIMVPIVIIFWIVVLKLRERSRALSFACKSSDGFSRASKIVSDFQKYTKSDDDGNPKSITDNHLVGIIEAKKMWEKYGQSGDFDFSSPEIITLNHVRGIDDDKFLLGAEVKKELTNTCLSFSMFSVLLAKIAGYKVNVKIFNESDNKLSSDSFQLIEAELEFLYDYLFTNYYAIYERGIWKKVRDLIVITLFFWLTVPLLFEYRSENHNILYVLLFNQVLDNGYTRVVILAIIVIEYTQIGVFFTSKWAKVMYTCSYLGNRSSTKRKLLRILIKIALFISRLRLPFTSRFSKRNIRQYSILESHSAIPLTMWCECWIGSYIDVPSQGRTGYKDKKVPKEVQQAILNAITNCLRDPMRDGKFSNGGYCLGQNAVEGNIISKYIMDSDAISQTGTNLVWHIATTLLGREKAPSAAEEKIDFTTATIISNYSAYLAVFFPQLLSDHVYTTRCDFEDIVKQLKKEIYAEVGDEEASETPLNDSSILGQARALVGDLENHPTLWKTLAEFWTERFMFLALSDNSEAIEAHANSLCVGGEYITHVWALLLHAGCSK